SGPRRRHATLFLAEFRFVQSEAQRLAAHVRAIAAVKRQQREKLFVARSTLISFGEEIAEIRPAARVQIHRQKRGFARHVAAAEAVIEFDAIVNADAAILHTDAFAAQVAMPVDNPRQWSLARATIEEVGFCLDLFIHPRTNPLIRRSADRTAHERLSLDEVLVPVVTNLVEAAPFRYLGPARGRAMKFPETSGDAINDRFGDGVIRDHPVEHQFIRQPFHPDAVINDLSLSDGKSDLPVEINHMAEADVSVRA